MKKYLKHVPRLKMSYSCFWRDDYAQQSGFYFCWCLCKWSLKKSVRLNVCAFVFSVCVCAVAKPVLKQRGPGKAESSSTSIWALITKIRERVGLRERLGLPAWQPSGHKFTPAPWKQAAPEKPLCTTSKPGTRSDWLNCLHFNCLMASDVACACATNVTNHELGVSFVLKNDQWHSWGVRDSAFETTDPICKRG